MFEPLTVTVRGAVGMLRFCLEPISVNSVLVTFRESLNVSSASMVPFFYSNNLAFLACLYVHPPPTLKTKQNGGEREGCHTDVHMLYKNRVLNLNVYTFFFSG